MTLNPYVKGVTTLKYPTKESKMGVADCIKELNLLIYSAVESRERRLASLTLRLFELMGATEIADDGIQAEDTRIENRATRRHNCSFADPWDVKDGDWVEVGGNKFYLRGPSD